MTNRKKITRKPSDPIFVAISDIHFNLANLELSSIALKAALAKAEQLNVELVIAGDLNDTKAIIRAEVANAIIKILKWAQVPVHIIAGNHDLINEKGKEHGLNYLAPYALITDQPESIFDGVYAIPYQSDLDELEAILDKVPAGEIIVMHQGVNGANMGDYVIDKTSISSDLLALHTCISGHYHRHQTVGTLTYIGSPFTMSFGEANDGAKGFLVVNRDGSFTREILNLRKHVIKELHVGDRIDMHTNEGDLLWVKLFGPKSLLDKTSKKQVAEAVGHDNFKLDKIYEDIEPLAENTSPKLRTNAEILDSLIDQLKENEPMKKSLKKLWRESV